MCQIQIDSELYTFSCSASKKRHFRLSDTRFEVLIKYGHNNIIIKIKCNLRLKRAFTGHIYLKYEISMRIIFLATWYSCFVNIRQIRTGRDKGHFSFSVSRTFLERT